jgi:hypothetical protein
MTTFANWCDGDVAKITPRDFANIAKQVKNKEWKEGRFILGFLYGVISKVKFSTDMLGDEKEMLIGEFRGYDAECKAKFRSDKMMLWHAVRELLSDTLASAGKNDPVQFAWELGIVRSSNALGWSWAIRTIVAPAVVSPINALAEAVDEFMTKPEAMAPAAAADDENASLPGVAESGIDTGTPAVTKSAKKKAA